MTYTPTSRAHHAADQPTDDDRPTDDDTRRRPGEPITYAGSGAGAEGV
jgi:hypothetical protein